jgi:transcriptional regulator GlxA family with amidase domain
LHGAVPALNTRAIAMIGFEGIQVLDVTGPLEVFSRASRLLVEQRIADVPPYHVVLAAREAGPVNSSSGLAVVARCAWRNLSTVDTLLVSGGVGVDRALEDLELIEWLRTQAPRSRRYGSVCTGAILLARAGLLRNRRVTTHSSYFSQLTALEPTAQVDNDAVFVRDGALWTSAGVMAGMDMALAMVEEDWGQPIALAVAQELVMYLKRPGGQSQFSRQLAAQFSDNDRLRDLQMWMLENLDADLTVPTLARRVAMSERNFARRFVEAVGLAPGKYVEQARVEAARRRLEQTDHDVARIAARCGFGSAETMRRAFIKHLAIPPSEYRARFRTAAPQEQPS